MKMRFCALVALVFAGAFVTHADQPTQVDENNAAKHQAPPARSASVPVDQNNRALDAVPAPVYTGSVDQNNRPLEPDTSAEPVRQLGARGRDKRPAGREAVATEILTFPAAGDTRFNLVGSSFWNAGDYVEGVRLFADPANEVEMTLSIVSNGLSCDTQDHALMIDGLTVGLFSVSPGDAQVIRNFVFPTIASGSRTIRIETLRTVAGGCGSAGFPDDVSTLAFELTPGDKLTFPAVGDTHFNLTGTLFWNQGDYVEGVRNLTEAADEVEMMLFISPNGLSCDTQDHALMIDGAIVGTFSVSPGETQITRRFPLFPGLAPGSHTMRVETTRTVNGGCGSAGLPDDVSMLSFFFVPGDKLNFPATGDTRFNLFGSSFWNAGDHVEGVRTFTEPTDEVEMKLSTTWPSPGFTTKFPTTAPSIMRA